VHKRTDSRLPKCHDGHTPREDPIAFENHMLFTAAVVIVLAAVAIVLRMRMAGLNADDLGWMSEQWLAEHRASHST
jgi:hypothetical protein